MIEIGKGGVIKFSNDDQLRILGISRKPSSKLSLTRVICGGIRFCGSKLSRVLRVSCNYVTMSSNTLEAVILDGREPFNIGNANTITIFSDLYRHDPSTGFWIHVGIEVGDSYCIIGREDDNIIQ